jgi:hypothetical protein
MSATPHEALRRVQATPVEPFLPGAAHAWQALAGFASGGLVAAVLMLGSAALSTDPLWEVLGRFGGFAIGGAMGGAALAWGLPGDRGWKHGAFGFAIGMLIPAFLAGPAVTEIISFQSDRDWVAVSLAAFIAFSTGYGIGGSLAMSFVWPKLFWAAGWRFFFAGGLGGLICVWGSELAGDPKTLTAERAVLSTVAVLAGHLTPFVLGGWLAGRSVDVELKPKPRRRRR